MLSLIYPIFGKVLGQKSKMRGTRPPIFVSKLFSSKKILELTRVNFSAQSDKIYCTTTQGFHLVDQRYVLQQPYSYLEGSFTVLFKSPKTKKSQISSKISSKFPNFDTLPQNFLNYVFVFFVVKNYMLRWALQFSVSVWCWTAPGKTAFHRCSRRE